MNSRPNSSDSASQVQPYNLVSWRKLALVAIFLVGALSVASLLLDPSGFIQKLAEALLQLGLIAILGALATYIADYEIERRNSYQQELDRRLANEQRDHDKRAEFLRRMSSAHVKIARARLLIIAHGSAKSYTEQLRNLMHIQPELDEIVEDLKVAKNLFGVSSSRVIGGVSWISSYLSQGIDEYVRFHGVVDEDGRRGRSLSVILNGATVDGRKMDWAGKFIGGEDLPESYNTALEDSKLVMREWVLGDSH